MPKAPQVCAPAEHLYIGVPAYTGSLGVHTMHSISLALDVLISAGVKVTTNFVAGCCYLDHTRNLLVKHFLESSATDLLFVDADVGFEPQGILAMALARRPLVAGVYPKKGEPPVQWPVELPPKFDLDSDGLIAVNYMPTGFMRINRSVLDYMRESPGLLARYHDRNEGDLVAYFHCQIRDNLYWGEDYQFCADWKSQGGTCWVLPNLDFSHTGPKAWKGNLMEWISDKCTSHRLVPAPESGSSAA